MRTYFGLTSLFISDLTVLESISSGPKMIEGLRTFVREFTETYVYLPGYTDHTVEKICQMCSKAAQVENEVFSSPLQYKIIFTLSLYIGAVHSRFNDH
jgi:hypothetical protein